MQRKSIMPQNVVKLKTLFRRQVYNLKPDWQNQQQPKKACRPKRDYIGKTESLLPLPPALMIGGLSDVFFALFAHIGQETGTTTVYRRLTKFEITVKGPAWTPNTARTFLFLAEYFQKVWWYRPTSFESKLLHLTKVNIKDLLLSNPSVFKKPLHLNVLTRQEKEIQTIAQTTLTLRDLETGEIFKKFADVQIVNIWNADTLTTPNMERRYANYPPDLERQYANYPQVWNADTLTTLQDTDLIDDFFAIGKINREEFMNLGKLNPQAVNYVGGALMWIQAMTGGFGKYKLQAFDCELPADQRQMSHYLSRAFFSSWRNTGDEKRADRNVCFETYAAIIGMSSYLDNRNRNKIIKILNETAPYFCTLWAVEDNILKFVINRTSDRKKDIYNG